MFQIVINSFHTFTWSVIENKTFHYFSHYFFQLNGPNFFRKKKSSRIIFPTSYFLYDSNKVAWTLQLVLVSLFCCWIFSPVLADCTNIFRFLHIDYLFSSFICSSLVRENWWLAMTTMRWCWWSLQLVIQRERRVYKWCSRREREKNEQVNTVIKKGNKLLTSSPFVHVTDWWWIRKQYFCLQLQCNATLFFFSLRLRQGKWWESQVVEQET